MPYTTPEAVKLELGSGFSSDDALLETYIAQVKDVIDHTVGFGFEATADTIRYLDANAQQDGRRLALPYPLVSATTVVNGDGTVLLASNYFGYPYDPPYRFLTLYASYAGRWTYTTDPERAIAVTGRWAWSLTAPLDIVRAATRMVAYWYRLKDAQVFDVTADPATGQLTIPKGIPVDVKLTLDWYRRSWIRG